MTTPGGGEPRTVDVPLSAPAPTVSYTLPPGVTFDVEAVYVEVDASGAGGAVTAELSIAEQSGVVIAKKAQGSTIPAGSSGTATWALRLDEGAAGGGTDPLAVHYDRSPQTGTFLESRTSGNTDIAQSGAGGQVNVHSDDGAGGGGFIGLTTDDGEVFIGSGATVVRLSPSGGSFEIQNAASQTIVRVFQNRYIDVRLGAATELNVLGPLSTPILRITDGGGGVPSYQIKTGGAWVANL